VTALDPRTDLTLREMAAREAEERLGRNLTTGELHLDIIGWGRDLDEGKAQLAEAIQAELNRAIRALVAGKGNDSLRITPAMEDALVELYEKGVEHARREQESMGLRAFAEDDDEEPRGVHGIMDYVNRRQAQGLPVADKFLRLVPFLSRLYGMMRAIEERMRKEALVLDFGAMTQGRLFEILERKVPGATDAAGRIVSGAMTSGLGKTWEEYPGILAWQYSAVMDGATCAVCRAEDGRVFQTIGAAFQVLPNFGPNPLCYGDGRCRCRLVPVPPSEADEAEVGGRPPEARTLAALARRRENEVDERYAGDGSGTQPWKTRLDETSSEALADIDKAIGGPLVWEGRPAAPIEIKWGKEGMDETIAMFRYSFSGLRMPDVQVNPEKGYDRGPVGLRQDLVHEFGHYLDVVFFGRAKRRYSGEYGGSVLQAFDPLPGDEPPVARERLHELMELIDATEASARLRSIASGTPVEGFSLDRSTYFANYMLRPREMFARAFTQWVAWAAEDKELMGSVRGTRNRYDDFDVPWYWNDDEFFEIAQAFDRLFREARGLN